MRKTDTSVTKPTAKTKLEGIHVPMQTIVASITKMNTDVINDLVRLSRAFKIANRDMQYPREAATKYIMADTR